MFSGKDRPLEDELGACLLGNFPLTQFVGKVR